MTKFVITQTGTGNLAFAGINDSSFNIFINNTREYKELVEQLTTLEKLLSRTPDSETEERLQISQKIRDVTQRIEQFKAGVLQLAAELTQTKINDNRLKRAKESFQKGELSAARAILETEIDQLKDEQTRLLAKRDEYQGDILPKLKDNAEQFFILSLLSQLDDSKPNWFANTCRYFEDSIRSHPSKKNVFWYAGFLWKHNKIAEAEKYYQMYLCDFASELSAEERAGALNNLGLLHWDSNEFVKGLAECEEALTIYRNLSKDDPSRYLPEVAGALNNIAMLRNDLGESAKALSECEEVLRIYRGLAARSPRDYLFDVAKVLSNLGAFNTGRKKHKAALGQLRESLAILRKLAEVDSTPYAFYVATSLHNLGVLHLAMGDHVEAERAYGEALAIRLGEARANPNVYLPEASCTLSNLAVFYADGLENRDKSIEYALETIRIVFPICKHVPFTQRYLQAAIGVLKRWGLTNEEIVQCADAKASSRC